MGVAQKPPGSVPDTEEVTAQTVVPEELVAMMTNPNLELQASNANDPHAQEDRTSDVEANEASTAAHDPHADRSHALRTSGVGLAPLAGSSNLGIAPLGPPPTSRFGASPLGFASPLSAQMPPPEVYSRASRPTPLPVPAAAPAEETPHAPRAENVSNATNSSPAAFPLASAAHVADEPPPDSGWGSERPPLAEGSSDGDDSLTKIIPASRIALESPEVAADSASVPAPSEPDATQLAGVTEPALATQENLAAVALDASEPVIPATETHVASVENASVESEQGWSTSVENAPFESEQAWSTSATPVENAPFENAPLESEQGWSTSVENASVENAPFEHASVEHASVENERGWSTSATPVENASVVSPAEMRVLDDQAARSSESDSVGAAFEEAGTWSQVPREASPFTSEPSPRGELASTNELPAQDEPAPPASGEVLTGSTSHGAIETASTATSEWRGASATRGATLPGIDLDSASSAESLATPIYVASALSNASASAVTATQAPLKSPESASIEVARETTPEPFARSKIGRTQPPPLPANAVAKPAEGSEPAAFVSDVAVSESANLGSPTKGALGNPPFSRPPAQIVTPLPRSVPPAMSVTAEVQPSVAGKSRTSKFTLALWALTVVGAFAGGWHWAGTSNQRKLAAASTSLSTQVLAARESGRAEAIAAIPGPPAILDLSVPSGAKSIGEILRIEPSERTKSEAVALGRQWQAKRFDEFAKFSADLRQNPAHLDDFKIRVAALEFVQDRLTSRAALELLAEVPSARALDLLYAVWTGSKERNETTQLAEALLFSKEVRPQVSGSLELALALRAKPTNCEVIKQLVARAIREGDRRSANQLVATSARRNCGDDGATDCVKCLDDARDMRKAIRASAMRPEPSP